MKALVEILRTLGLPASYIVLVALMVFTINTHREDRKEDQKTIVNLTEVVIETVKENTAAFSTFSTIVSHK
jgi:hypothetical protein